jgi:Family of unknown function (DUF5317)
MVLLTGFAVAVIVVLIFGGRLGRLADLELRSAWLLYLALALQLIAFPASNAPWSPGESAAVWIAYASYACLVAATVQNRRLPGALVLGTGMLLNLIAIAANGGHMPAMASALRAVGKTETGVHQNSVALAHPNLPWLVDRFAAPRQVPFANIFSVGDVLIVLGAGLILWSATGAHLPGRGPRDQQLVERGLAGGPSGTP